MLTEIVHQKNCTQKNIITDEYTGEIAGNNCGVVFSKSIQKITFKILSIAQKNNISPRPRAMSSADIHLATLMNKEKVSQLNISEASLSTVTIRNRSKELER